MKLNIKKKLKSLEFWIFKKLLHRFIEKEMDQWERWELDSKFGKVYVSISRQSDGYTYNKIN